MSKKQKTKPPESWEYKEPNQKFARLYCTMLTDKRFLELKPRVRMLYVYMKLQYKGDANKNAPNGDKAQFVFPQHLAFNVYQLYTNQTQFRNDIKELINKGFIECVENKKNLRQPNVYKFSNKWKNESS